VYSESAVGWSNSVRNLSEIEQPAAKLLRFYYVQFGQFCIAYFSELGEWPIWNLVRR